MSERFYVEGGKRLQGEIQVSGAKNAALKFVAAALLAPGKTVLHHVPRIKDMHTMLALLDELGVRTNFSGSTLEIDASTVETSGEWSTSTPMSPSAMRTITRSASPS